MKKVDAILCSDLHIREDVPICRIDDFMSAQTKKLNFIRNLALEHNCPVLIAGDIFNKARSSPYVEGLLLKEFFSDKISFEGIPGQHDLPAHSMKLYEHSSLCVMERSGKIKISIQFHLMNNREVLILKVPFGMKINNPDFSMYEKTERRIVLLHQMVHHKEKIHGDVKSTSAISLLKNNDFDLIVTGDNHKPFVVEYGDKLLVNCGSMMRTTASQVDYKPAVWLWNKKSNSVEPAYLPIEKNVVIRDHIDAKEIKDKKMMSFVESAKKNYEVGLSFKDNMENSFGKNNTRKGIKDEIYIAYGE